MLELRQAVGRTVEERTSAAFVLFLIATGARRSEAGQLKWEDVHLKEGWFEFPATVTKTHVSHRLPITPLLKQLLESLPRRESNPYCFASSGVKHRYITLPRAAMKAVSKIAGIALSPHDLRRTADSIAKEAGVDADDRRAILAHAASDIHSKHYGNDVTPKALAKAVETMHAWIVTQVCSLADQVNLREAV